MSLRRQRRQRAEAELALQQALGDCRQSADGALAPLRRHWPALLIGSGALAGWLLARRPPSAAALAPSALLGQALGLLPLLLRWNALLGAPAAMAAEATLNGDGAASAPAADAAKGHTACMDSCSAPSRQADGPDTHTGATP